MNRNLILALLWLAAGGAFMVALVGRVEDHSPLALLDLAAILACGFLAGKHLLRWLYR